MKNRTDVIAAAAMKFAGKLVRKPRVATALDATLPDVAKEANAIEPFVSKVVVPRKLSKVLVSGIIERILTGQKTATEVQGVLVASEKEYVAAVLDEVYTWAQGQGFEVRS